MEDVPEKQEAARKTEEARIAAEKHEKSVRKTVLIVLPLLAAAVASVILSFTVIQPNQRYNEAKALYDAGQYAEAAILYGKAGTYRDAKEKSAGCLEKVAVRETIAAGGSHTVGLRSDGTVIAVGENALGQCDVSDWKDIKVPKK